jgi:TatD DNase family protein
MFVDSHCHLNYPPLNADIPGLRQAMETASVTSALIISTTLETFDDVLQLAVNHPNFWCTVGVHPDEEGVREPSIDDLIERARHPRVVGIGETGLDYYRLGERRIEDMEWQRERFRRHIRAARESRLPLVIHTRNSAEDTLRILQEEGETGGHDAVGGVFHCFTESQSVAERAVDMGFHISLSGILTFKNAVELREVAAWVPLDRLLIETDSPYLAPVPYRGKTNQPAYVAEVGRALAQLRELDVDTVAEVTSDNFRRLFSRTQASK